MFYYGMVKILILYFNAIDRNCIIIEDIFGPSKQSGTVKTKYWFWIPGYLLCYMLQFLLHVPMVLVNFVEAATSQTLKDNMAK